MKRETAEGLALFRQQQEEADKKARKGSEGAVEEGSPTLEEESWVSGGRKRKRTKEKEGLKGVKIGRASTSTELKAASPPAKASPAPKPIAKTTNPTQPPEGSKSETGIKKSPAPAKGSGGGLVDYGSDEDDEW